MVLPDSDTDNVKGNKCNYSHNSWLLSSLFIRPTGIIQKLHVLKYLIKIIGYCYHLINRSMIKMYGPKVIPLNGFRNFRLMIISHYPVLLLVKTRYLTTLLNSNEDPQISSLECFIEVLENSPEQSVERKLAAQQPGKD